ncbi:MAG: DUF4369 domain-containing protein [Candidatus Amulumruptor caecigallinarius]|nr:DUF4369 domain-containing protein [Candidatus Amulumruptor caecigallinarius]MCM1396618.1 DUF4369 domain-containing protein [Candidatus Amulumruptor caecigallinarius]MCM1453324.1 DUF4369 domain-containing protein [bacterium]
MTFLQKISISIAAVALMAAAACSRPDHFTVEGNVSGLADGEVTLTCYTSSAIMTERMQAAEGRFKLRGESPDYAMAELRMTGNQRGVTFVVRNGDKIKVEGPAPDSLTLSGTKPVKEINKWCREYADALRTASPDSINALIEAYVADKGTTAAGAWMLLTRYDALINPAEASELFDRFNADKELSPLVTAFADMVTTTVGARDGAKVYAFNVRGAGDSLVMFNPMRHRASLLAFTDETSRAARRRLCNSLAAVDTTYTPRELRIVELSMARDSAAWRDAVKADTLVTWSRIYLPAGSATTAIRTLRVPRAPYYIVADYSGAQRYRGISLDAALDTVKTIVSRHRK